MVEIDCFSRLNFGLIDLSNEPFRVDGSIGLATDLKLGRVLLKESSIMDLNFNGIDNCRYREVIERCLKITNNRKVSLHIESYVNEHIGLGTGTQIALSIVKAFDEEFTLNLSINEIAMLAKSGGTSNIGIYSFFDGGFNVDSGRLFNKEKHDIGPSEMFLYDKISPRLLNLKFPDWFICIAVPRVPVKVCDRFEVNLFKKYTPIPVEEVNCLCKWILMGLLPSIQTEDFDAFCYCIEKCMNLGFKKREIGTYSDLVFDSIEDLKSKGARGVGMTSFGPSVFGFYNSYEKALSGYNAIKNSNKYENIYLTKPRNIGAKINKI